MKRVLLASLGLLWIAASSASAADYYLKIEGIEGEVSGGGGGAGALAIESWSFGASNPSSMSHGSGMGAGKMAAPAADPAPGAGELTLQRVYDKASPMLAKHCAAGQHFPKAVVQRCENGACRTVELENVMVSSFSVHNDGSGAASESVTLRYHQWRWLDAAGSSSASELRESPTRQSLKVKGSSVGKPNPGN